MINFKKVLVMILTLAFLAALCGCNEVRDAENALNSAITALQEGDYTKASGYVNGNEFLENNEMLKNAENTENVAKALFSKLICKINSSEKIDNSNVKINADVTNVNTENAFKNTITQAFSLALSGNVSQDEMESKILEIFTQNLSGEDVETVTSTIDINMVKTDDGWKVDADEKLQDAITGGLVSAAENFGSSFGE